MENSFGKRLKGLRNMKGKTQEQLAESCGVSPSTVVRWEADTLHPNQKHQRALAEVLGVKVDDFYVKSELPLPENHLLAEILETVAKLDQPFQMYVLQMARSLVKLTHPKSK